MGASEADAAIVYFDVNPDRIIFSPNSLYFGSINLGTATYSLGATTAPSFSLATPFSGSGPTFGGTQIQAGAGSGYYTFRLSYGATISAATIPDSDWSFNTYSGYWLSGDSGYIPLRMVLGGGNYNYGWAQVSVATNGGSITVSGFAFESTANTAIQAGNAVPEPSTVALAGVAALVLGGSAYMRSRRRREAEQKEAA